MIYLDSAATSYHKPDGVARAVAEAISHMGNPGRGAHEASLDASRVVYGTREKMAELFGAEEASQIVFTANSTESLNIAIQGLADPGDHVITTVMEHNSVLRPLYLCQQRGVSLTILPFSAAGTVTPEAIEAVIRSNTRMIVCTHGSNLTGDLNDLEAIGRVCKKHHLLFVVDASQTAGVFPIQMDSMNIDVLCFTGHKSLMGPQGTGGLCVRKGVEIRQLLSGGSGILTFEKEHPSAMPVRLEAGTLNTHGIAGLLAGVRYLMEEERWKNFQEKELRLAELFYRELKDCPKFIFYGNPAGGLRAPVISLNLREEDSGEVSDWLFHEYGICTRPGGHCAPLMHEFFHTERQGMVRFSFSHGNTEEEVRRAAAALREMTEQ